MEINVNIEFVKKSSKKRDVKFIERNPVTYRKKAQTQKARQNEMAEEKVLDDGTRQNSEEQLSEVQKVGNLPEKDFRVMTVRLT